jgi:peptide/nickel transport system permease protein
MRSHSTLYWAGWGILGVLAACAVLAPGLAPHDPFRPSGLPLEHASRDHLLGTNDLGQDQVSLLLYGARSTLAIAASVALISTVLSWTVGLVAGCFKRAEGPLIGLTDLIIAVPNIPLYFLVLTLVGPSRRHIIIVLAMLSWPPFARIVRGIVLSNGSEPYVEASRSLGATEFHVLRRHYLPATLDVLPTKLITTVRYAVFAEATFSFLGLGGTRASWGAMLNWAFSDPLLFRRADWALLVVPPTAAIILLVMATSFISTELVGGGFSVRLPHVAPVRDQERSPSSWSAAVDIRPSLRFGSNWARH